MQGHYHYNGLGRPRKRDILRSKVLTKLGYNICTLVTHDFMKRREFDSTFKDGRKNTYVKDRIRLALQTME